MTSHLTDRQLAQRARRQEFTQRSLVVAACVVVLLTLVGLTYNGFIVRSTLQTVRSCTTPTGACYERGQRTTGEAVANINRVVVYAAVCADRRGVSTRAEIERCVLSLLEDQDTQR